MIVYNVYLPIGDTLRNDCAPIDPTYLLSRGIEPEALTVLHHVREDVCPLIRDLKRKRVLKSFSFLIHDRTSGVPTDPEDRGAYIHLRLTFKRDINARKVLPKKWVMLKRVKPTKAETCVHDILDQQSATYLDIVSACDKDGVDLLQHVGQHLHYWANMAQMRVS